MLSLASLLTFSLRALIVLLVLSVLWVNVAGPYNEVLVAAAGPLLPSEVSLRALGAELIYDHPQLAESASVRGYAMHYGAILMAVLVLAAVGIGLVARVGWLLASAAGFFLLHIAGVVVMAWGIDWAATRPGSDMPGTLVLALFAAFWGLVPAVAGGAWCILYWRPRVGTAAPPHSDRQPSPVPADQA